MNSVMAKENSKYPEEVLYYIEYVKQLIETTPDISVKMLENNQISLSTFLDIAAQRSLANFEKTGNPILQVEDIVQLCYQLIIENNIVDLLSKGWIEVTGINEDNKPIYQITEIGKRNLLKDLTHGKKE